MSKRKCHFRDEWLLHKDYKDWIKKIPDDEGKAYCKVCMTSFSVSGSGISALDIHAKGKKHLLKCPGKNQARIELTSPKKNQPDSVSEPVHQSSVTSFITKEEAVKAEIRWTLETLQSNYSFNSCSQKSELFAAMFSDSTIAKQFSMGKTKCGYYLTYGMAPYFKDAFVQNLKEIPFYSVSFDESYNKVMKQGQMDLHIRYWNSKTDRVNIHYLNSSFMGKSAAIDMLEHFNSCVESIEKHKILKVFSDGPNVNLSFLKLLDEHRRDADLNPLINIGTCGLHTVHNSFKHGEKESDWNIKKLLNSMFKIFDESPSRRADYERINSASKSDFPLRFCSHRWVENDVVANRALSIWSKVIEVLDYWKGLPKSKQPGRGRPGENKSYDFLLSKMNDLLVPVKLRFFEETAKKLNNFLVTFQTSSPVVPFLVDSLESLVRSFAERFILLDVLKQANTTLKRSIWLIQTYKWEPMQ